MRPPVDVEHPALPLEAAGGDLEGGWWFDRRLGWLVGGGGGKWVGMSGWRLAGVHGGEALCKVLGEVHPNEGCAKRVTCMCVAHTHPQSFSSLLPRKVEQLQGAVKFRA